ncbi:MAG: hypothetical protein K8F31_08735 [Roseovarius sp.]|nr:hypothetical protein [Roseovarius sp.]
MQALIVRAATNVKQSCMPPRPAAGLAIRPSRGGVRAPLCAAGRGQIAAAFRRAVLPFRAEAGENPPVLAKNHIFQ